MAADPDGALGSLDWKVEHLKLYGRVVAQPRLTAVCGRSKPTATRYRRPNLMPAWSPVAGAIRDLVAARCRDGSRMG